MGLFDFNWSKSKNVSSPYVRSTNPQKENITDKIKEALETTNYIENYAYDFREFGINKTLKNNMVTSSIYNETNPWYDNHFKNNLLNNMTRKLTSRLLDNYNIYEYKNDIKNIVKQFSIKIDNTTYPFYFTEEILQELCAKSLLYSKCYLKFNLVDGRIKLEVLDPYKIKLDTKNNIAYQLYYDKDMTPSYVQIDNKVERFYKWNEKLKRFDLNETIVNPLKMTGVYEFNFNYNLINKGTLENILMYTKIDTLLAKEINNGTLMIFADQSYFTDGFNPEQIGMRYVNTPENNKIDNSMNTLFQVVQHDLRAESIRNLHDLLKEKTAESLMLDKSSLGLDSTIETATATKIKNSTSIDTINSLKQCFEDSFNHLLFDIFKNNDYKLYVESYKNSDLESLLQQAQLGLVGGSMSVEKAVHLVNNDLTPEELIKEIVLVKIENGKTMTNEEKQFAIDNNLIDKGAFEF